MQKKLQQELKARLESEYVRKAEEWTDINMSTAGLVNLTVVSDLLVGLSMSERKHKINAVLSELHAEPGFISPYTIEESASFNLSRPRLLETGNIHTWQDLALWAANPQNQSQSSHSAPHIPRTVTFYSFKGGVGRTTALTHVAWILAMRGRKVVAVDLDLEAPGLSTAFKLTPQPAYGIVDYFYERSYLPTGIEPNISISQIFGEVRITDAPGRLFVVPAGSLDFDYISKVDDLRATNVSDRGETLWSIFSREINDQLKPDIILVDSRTGINQWGALSLLEAADEAIIFLFPNEQNQQGIELLLKSLNSFDKLSINFVFSPVPDISDTGMEKVRERLRLLNAEINHQNGDKEETEEETADPLIVPYLQPIAMAESYPVSSFLDYYNRIANSIDEDTDRLRVTASLTEIGRWQIVKSLKFPALNAADPRQNLNDLFQRTANFEKFLDESTCLIKGRKGTGKTALYLLLLKHSDIARKLAHGRLEKVILFSGHGTFHDVRPSRNEFQIIDRELTKAQGSWESCWRAYLLLRIYQNQGLKISSLVKGSKYQELRKILQNISGDRWQSEHTQALIRMSTEEKLRLVIPDALDLINDSQKQHERSLWFIYDDLDEDFPERAELRQQALTGLFQLIQACDARKLTAIRFKIFLREDIWSRLNFDNKSHFNGRDLLLAWSRIDFLRLALRQSMQSSEFKNLVNRSTPIENIDTASEDNLSRALESLWGSRRRSGDKAKYVFRWIYEKLTDSSGTSFPRSLSALLQGAKEQELTYETQASVQLPLDRLLRSKSLEIGLEKASEERCDAIKQEYPDLCKFFDSLEGVSALPSKAELEQKWQDSTPEENTKFEDFASFLAEIGVVKWREKEQRYAFPDIYVYGFKMNRPGAR
jgi:cellulose biosynthesis protein BcsQ